MKIKLIAPHEQREDTISTPFKLQRVNLPLLAALTPPGHTITIVEEAFAPDDIGQDVDLVGITVLTELAPRAYQIGDTYRRKGVKVVMGGIHPTVLPEEALEHAERLLEDERSAWRALTALSRGDLPQSSMAWRSDFEKNWPHALEDVAADVHALTSTVLALQAH